MDELNQLNTPIKSALFVDFDNIYIGLSKTDPAAAERFASDPARWLSWLEKGLPAAVGSSEASRPRSILIRRCYPNPDAGFRRFRSFFTSAAFSVIDCPSHTRTGKNSSDIYMVMDILDTLEHKTHFDEFIIFSGDSDFMPVLLRLRAHDRRTTTLAVDFMPPAYKAACDLVINEETFIEDALGVSHEGSCAEVAAVRARVAMSLLKEMAARVYDATCEEGEVAGASMPEILKDFREFRDSTNWLGFGTSQRLAEALVCCEPRLQVVRINPMMYKLVAKPESITVHPQQIPAVPGGKNGERQPAERPSRTLVVDRPLKPEQARLRTQVIELVREIVAKARAPLLLARVSQDVVSRLGPQVLESQWGGAGSFKRLLQSTDHLGLEITTQPEPGYIFDPNRHAAPVSRRGRDKGKPAPAAEEKTAAPEQTALEGAQDMAQGAEEQPLEKNRLDTIAASEMPSEPEWLEEMARAVDTATGYEEEDETAEEEEYEEALPSLDEFIHRVSRVTGAPELTPHQYALAFQGIVRELQSIALGEKPYNTYQSSKAISDWCVEQGETVTRNDVVLILKGIIFQDGVRFGKRPGSYTDRELAHIVRSNIKALCQRSRLELSEYEDHLLDEWILGGLEEI